MENLSFNKIININIQIISSFCEYEIKIKTKKRHFCRFVRCIHGGGEEEEGIPDLIAGSDVSSYWWKLD